MAQGADGVQPETVPTPSIRAVYCRSILPCLFVAALAFYVAFEYPPASSCIVVFLFCLFPLSRTPSARLAFYTGLFLGLLTFAPQLLFFWKIFGVLAVAFWTLLSLAPAFFMLLAYVCRVRFSERAAILLMPLFWTGFEYLRCEATYLRFTWLAPGFAFSQSPLLLLPGVYGITFVLLTVLALVWLLPRRFAFPAGLLLLGAVAVLGHERPSPKSSAEGPWVVGVQLEGASEREIVRGLDGALADYPDADLFVLCEYAFASPVPPVVRDWCKAHARYLVAGGMDPAPAPSTAYTNTAFVIGPDGEVIFHQGKSVPIQFFSDGLPARNQELWESPWGRIGLCICYDLSYRSVTDALVRKGAQALIVPTMDAESWGLHEHVLHGLVAPTRAAEYGVPIFRLCSSGISQLVLADGRIAASAPFPGQGAQLAGRLPMSSRTGIPFDWWLAPICCGITHTLAVVLLVERFMGRRRRRLL